MVGKMKKPNIYKLTFIIGFLLMNLTGWSQKVQLNKYIKEGIKNNAKIKALTQHYLSAKEQLLLVTTLPDPKVGIGSFLSPVETRVGSQQVQFSISQSFPWFGQLKAQEKVAYQQTQVILEELKQLEHGLQYEITKVYNQLYFNKEVIVITKNNLELFTTLKELAILKFEARKGRFSDVLKVDMELIELNNRLEDLSDEQLPLYKKMEELLNRPIAIGSLILPNILWEEKIFMDKKVLKDMMISHNPIFKKYEHKIKAAKFQEVVANKMKKPSFTLGIKYILINKREIKSGLIIPDNGKNAFALPVVDLSIPIFRKKNEARIKEQQLKKEAIIFEQKQYENRLNTDFESIYQTYSVALRRIKMHERLLSISRQTLDIIIAEYTTSGNDFAEVIKIELKNLNHVVLLEKARIDRNNAVAYMNFLLAKGIH